MAVMQCPPDVFFVRYATESLDFRRCGPAVTMKKTARGDHILYLARARHASAPWTRLARLSGGSTARFITLQS